MAQVTIELLRFLNGQVTAMLTYDDRKMVASAVSLTNSSDRTAFVSVTDMTTGLGDTITSAPGTTMSKNLPRGGNYALLIDPSGQVTYGDMLITATFG